MKRLSLLIFFLAAVANAADKLTIVKAGPVGEIANLAEANEVRVVFSEPMVVVGKIPKELSIPWFHIEPAVKGTFRWSGTTTLIFTPAALPFATKFDVAMDASAKAVSDHTLGKPYRFSFTTPTIQLLSTDHYRKPNGAVVIALRFNQPVEPETIAQHLQLRTEAHEFKAPLSPVKADPNFDAKVARAAQNAASDGQPVMSFLAVDWDKKRFPPKNDLAVVETKPNLPPDTWLQVFLDDKLAKSGRVSSGKAQTFTLQLDPTLFVDKIECTAECNPESYNPIFFRTKAGLSFEKVKAATHVLDASGHELKREEKEIPEWRQTDNSYSLDELGYSLQPAHTYTLRVDPSLEAEDGQKLGYTFTASIENWHKTAFISFGDGHGVWESSGGPILPFHARNFLDVQQWLQPVSLEQVMPTMLALEKENFQKTPPAQRKLAPVADKTQSYGLNLGSALTNGRGIVWAAIKPGAAIPKANRYNESVTATLVQTTNLGLSVKDSPQNTLVFVTRLDDARPVAGAKVTIRTTENKVVWSGTTDERGLAAAPNTDLRADRTKENESESWSAIGELHFIVTAEKDGDVAYVASNWNSGISPFDFSLTSGFDLNEASPLLRGTIFTDRGVYKLGEEVHAKAVLRGDTPNGMQLFPAGTQVELLVRDSHDKDIDKRKVSLNEWSSAEWTFKVPADGVLGDYRISATVEKARLAASGEFLVAAYRRPEFRVDVAFAQKEAVAGAKLSGTITARYLFGAPMSSRPVTWTFAKVPVYTVPHAIAERFPEEQWTFLGEEYDVYRSTQVITKKDAKLDAKGELKLSLPTDLKAGVPWAYRLEGDVVDVSRQRIANRTSLRVDPAPWYVGVKNPPYFADAKQGIDTELVAAALDGKSAPGVPIDVELHRIQWNSVRQAAGHGFYNWETERKEVPAGTFQVTSKSEPVPLHVPLGEGGEYVLIATAKDAEGRSTTTRAWFYAVGGGYTAWARYDHNRIDLVAEKQTYRPGETARIMIKSPWERATALLTTEREGVRTWKTFELNSTQPTVTVPITDKDIPNIFVSVVLVKGRTKEGIEEEADPGKPSFRVGYVELGVEDATKRLKVDVKANKDEYRPATKARVDVQVKDAGGKPSQSEVTLWAVDYGVLSLTSYKTPDVLASMYLRKALQVITDDSREKIVSRRVLTPKGETQGGGGGRDAGPGTIRKDFRVLAFWLGSIATDRNGRARADVVLPESLTTYRIMAVAGDRASRFGWGENEIRINKPLLVTPAFPRFLALGDKATFGGVVHSQLKQGGKATVTIKSLDPAILDVGSACHPERSEGSPASKAGDSSRSAALGMTPCTIDLAAGGNVEVRFDAVAKAVGTARIQMSVAMAGENDAFEESLPVRLLTPAETVAAYGEANPTAKETLEVPKDVASGGLHVELASTAMVGLSEGAEYLIEYPYGCAEQRSSAAMATMLAGDLGEGFALPGLDAKKAHSIAQTTIYELYKFQCGDGGFSFWPGECAGESPFLTANVLHVMQRGQALKYDVSKDVLDRAYTYLDNQLKQKRPANEGWWPAYTAWQAFSVKVLAEGGKNVDSHVNRLITYVDRMPLFGIAFLADAMKSDPRAADLRRRIDNAILPEGGSAHVEELNDPYLMWYWNSNVRSTAIVLDTLTRAGGDEQPVKQMVRWLMQQRKGGRWRNTQENVWALEALVDYYRKYESVTPDFTALVNVGLQTLAKDAFKGRSSEAKSHDVPIASLKSGDVTFEKQGAGTLFYLMRLRYVPLGLMHEPRDQGFAIERKYSQETFKAGDLIKVTLKIRNTKERRFVAVTDPIPAGTEPVESWFATTATELAEQQSKADTGGDWMSWWQHGGFDHVERHDDRVTLFATRLGEGTHEFTYMVRATTAGRFVAAPAHVEEMYEPEVFGRTASAVVEVK
jgi:alpha-2-macroglobulin